MTEENNQQEELQNFLKQNISPLLQEENKRRQTFRSKFWLYFGILLFANCANILIVLFNHLINGKPFSWEQLTILVLMSAAVLYFLARRAKSKHLFILDEFIKFYGNWQNCHNETANIKADFLPEYDETVQHFDITGSNGNLELQNLVFLKNSGKNKKRRTGGGLLISYTLQHTLNGMVMMFEKGGFFKQKKYMDLDKYQSSIPAANYFYTFSDNNAAKNYVICAALFENVLNLRDEFKASKVYLKISQNQLYIFLQNGHFFYEPNDSMWKSAGTEKQFEQTHQQIEKLFNMLGVAEALTEAAR